MNVNKFNVEDTGEEVSVKVKSLKIYILHLKTHESCQVIHVMSCVTQ